MTSIICKSELLTVGFAGFAEQSTCENGYLEERVVEMIRTGFGVAALDDAYCLIFGER